MAEDLTSEVFASVITSIRHYEERGLSFEAWLFRIARARLADHFRQQQRRPAQVPLDDWEWPDEDELDDGPDPALRQALMSLSANEREVVLLHFGSGLDHAQMAAVLHTSPVAIRVRLHRALRKLREILEHRAQTESHPKGGRP